jgi:hypothetical protein
MLKVIMYVGGVRVFRFLHKKPTETAKLAFKGKSESEDITKVMGMDHFKGYLTSKCKKWVQHNQALVLP